MDRLETKSDNILAKSQQVTRRAERMIQQKSWAPTPATFVATITIRHAESGLFLASAPSRPGEVVLTSDFNPYTCVFDQFRRQGRMVSFRNHSTRKYLGQSLLGSFVCSADTFGRREEWEIAGEAGTVSEQIDSKTVPQTYNGRLLCASVGWGAGGYLMIRKVQPSAMIRNVGMSEDKDSMVPTWAISFGGATAEDVKKAAVWTLSVFAESSPKP
jgi:hypothetical protein